MSSTMQLQGNTTASVVVDTRIEAASQQASVLLQQSTQEGPSASTTDEHHVASTILGAAAGVGPAPPAGFQAQAPLTHHQHPSVSAAAPAAATATAPAAAGSDSRALGFSQTAALWTRIFKRTRRMSDLLGYRTCCRICYRNRPAAAGVPHHKCSHRCRTRRGCLRCSFCHARRARIDANCHPIPPYVPTREPDLVDAEVMQRMHEEAVAQGLC